jgi:hypothetical protein
MLSLLCAGTSRHESDAQAISMCFPIHKASMIDATDEHPHRPFCVFFSSPGGLDAALAVLDHASRPSVALKRRYLRLARFAGILQSRESP